MPDGLLSPVTIGQLGGGTTQVPNDLQVDDDLDVGDDLAIGGGSPWFDPTHPTFGAVGDGVTDDSAAIQAAITAAAGGTVFIPAGTYNLGTTGLAANSPDTKIMGAGKGSTILLYSGTGTAFTWGTGVGNPGHKFVLEDITIEGTSAGAVGIHFDFFQDFTMKNVVVTGFTNGIGYHYDSPNSGVAINCDATACATGIKIEGLADLNTWIGGQVTSNERAVHYLSTNVNSFRGTNFASNTTSPAIFIESGNLILDGCYFENNASGAGTASIECGDGVSYGTVMAQNCLFSEIDVRYAILLTRSLNSVIIGNRFGGAGTLTAAIRVEAPSTGNVHVANRNISYPLLVSDAGGALDTIGIGPGGSVGAGHIGRGATGFQFGSELTGQGANAVMLRATLTSTLIMRFLDGGGSQKGSFTTGGRLETSDGVQTKYLSGAGKVTVADSDFADTPPNGTIAVVLNTSDSTVRIGARANGTWKVGALA